MQLGQAGQVAHGFGAAVGCKGDNVRLDLVERGIDLMFVDFVRQRRVASVYRGKHVIDCDEIALMGGDDVVDQRLLGGVGLRPSAQKRPKHGLACCKVAGSDLGTRLEPILTLKRLLCTDRVARLCQRIAQHRGVPCSASGSVCRNSTPQGKTWQRDQHHHKAERRGASDFFRQAEAPGQGV